MYLKIFFHANGPTIFIKFINFYRAFRLTVNVGTNVSPWKNQGTIPFKRGISEKIGKKKSSLRFAKTKDREQIIPRGHSLYG